MKVFEPTLGPILGYTTNSQARFWLRGLFKPTAPGLHQRQFGVVQLREAAQRNWSKAPKARLQKLMPHFDMTGVVVFTGLKANTKYLYRAGWLAAEMELDDLEALLQRDTLDWSSVAEISFSTGTDDATAPRTFLAGSCRYLLKLGGFDFFDDRGDKVFRSMQEHPAHAVLMLGDQIYADDLNVLGQDRTVTQYFERYRTAFGQPHQRRLMGQLPTYMILDDHEIENDWPAHATQREWVLHYPPAIHAYQTYQASHSPLFELDAKGMITGTPEHLWYQFQDGCVDCFVMDVRTERLWSKEPAQRRMIKPEQMAALQDWLRLDSGRLKLIVSSVPFFPDVEEGSEDKWAGFLAERTSILDFIRENKVLKVVFLSGDVHCSFTAELVLPTDPQFKVVSVVSSSFFWPYPHMRSSKLQGAGPLTTLPGHPHGYEVANVSPVHSTDNFGRLEFTPAEVKVTFFDRKGDQLGAPVRHRWNQPA